MTLKQAITLFLNSAAAVALTVLIAAQTYDWASENFANSAETTAWGLLGAAIVGVIAVGWAYATSPAETRLGKALRQTVQVVLGLPIAGIVLDEVSDFVALGDLIVPTISLAILAFVVSYLRNGGIIAASPEGNDFLRGSPPPPPDPV